MMLLGFIMQACKVVNVKIQVPKVFMYCNTLTTSPLSVLSLEASILKLLRHISNVELSERTDKCFLAINLHL